MKKTPQEKINAEFLNFGKSNAEKAKQRKVIQDKYRPQNREYYRGLALIRKAIRMPELSIEDEIALLKLTGLPQQELLEYLGLDQENIRAKYNAGEQLYELDHIIGAAWCREHEKFTPYMHRYYNLRVLSKTGNRTKQRPNSKKTEPSKMTPEMIFAVMRMKLEQIEDATAVL